MESSSQEENGKGQNSNSAGLDHTPLLIFPCLPPLLLYQLNLPSNSTKPWENGRGRALASRRTEGKGLMFHNARRQPGYAVIPAHDRRKRGGKLCQTCIMDKAKAGSSARFGRTLINRVDRWSPMVPNPHENPFCFLVCLSVSHSLPLPEPVSRCSLHRSFSSLAERFLMQEHHLISLFASLPLSSHLFSIHIWRTHPLARPFACFVIGAYGANVRKRTLSII